MRSTVMKAAGLALLATSALAAVPSTPPDSLGPDPSLALLVDAAEAALAAGNHEEALAPGEKWKLIPDLHSR